MALKNIIIVGRGNLAEGLRKDLPVLSYKTDLLPEPGSVFVHTGSGREYEETLNTALEYGCPYIQAATEKDYSLLPPNPGTIPYIYAPNLDLTIIKFLYWLKMGQSLFKDTPKTITESHQATKKSVPGTAVKMCEILGIDPGVIRSIRAPEEQEKLPIKNKDHHAYHEIILGETDSFIRLETNVTGLTSYSKGLISLINCLPRLENRNYEIEELVEEGFLDSSSESYP